MSPERESNTEDKNQTLKEEFYLVRDLAQQGLFEAITPEAFNYLATHYPDFLTHKRMDALSTAASELHRGLRTANEEEVQENIASRMAYIQTEFAKLDFGGVVKRDPDSGLFWMIADEREGLKTVMWMGDHKAINSDNFPGLRGIDENVIVEMRCEAIDNRIKRITYLLDKQKEYSGYKQLREEDVVLKSLRERILSLQDEKRELLMSNET